MAVAIVKCIRLDVAESYRALDRTLDRLEYGAIANPPCRAQIVWNLGLAIG